ncbi:hypothetical protein Patl1_29550 [Pistacia atlantica]|uniref:Uncharacterized protein n=1 Tax=Pistacia atlantica TaxID=434234 RepID=A0ACC1AEJ5_9ROSI|nr:hypothetical protein Patl1_29550 [Pistacia atlantica]
MGGKVEDKSLPSTKDFEERGINIDPNWTNFQVLLVVAGLASLKLKEDHLMKKKKKQKKQSLVKSNGF